MMKVNSSKLIREEKLAIYNFRGHKSLLYTNADLKISPYLCVHIKAIF